MFENSYPKYVFVPNGPRLFAMTNFEWDKIDLNKPLIVFNYGLVCSSEHWRHQLVFFDKLGYQCLGHDYRAHYNSTGAEDIESVTFKNIASDLMQILKELGNPKTIHLGHSMGVNVTLEFCYRYPENVLGQILMSGAVVPPQDIMFDSNIFDLSLPGLHKIKNKFPNFYNKFWTTMYMNPLIRYLIHDGGFNVKQVPDDFIHLYLKRIGELSPDLFLQLLKEMKGHSVINHLHEINVPTLIISGDKDKVIPNYVQEIFYKNLKNTELYIVKEGSHVPQMDFPEELNERMLLFLNTVWPTNK